MLDWALRYGRACAERILADPDLDCVNRPASEHNVAGDPLAGIENLLASGAVYALGDLFALSGHEVFRDAARRIAAPLVPELLDPYGDPGPAAVGHYRWALADGSLDDGIRAVLAHMPEESGAELAMVVPQARRRRETGVGKRADMIYWGEWSDDGSVRPMREPTTAALTLAWQMTGDVSFARRALKTAAAKLGMARRVLRGGRDHACGAASIHAVAAGHGRNWGQGAVTACYGPLLLGTREVQSRVTPMVEVRGEGLVSLVRPPIVGDGEVTFYNGTDAAVRAEWRLDGEEWRPLEVGAGKSVSSPLART
jgi:hypothetical protein